MENNTISKNPKTGLVDNLNGDYSFKNFIKTEWDWSLIWLLFFVVSVIIIANLGWCIASIGDSFADDGVAAGLMVSVGIFMFPAASIGLTIYLRRWWLVLGGQIEAKGTIKK